MTRAENAERAAHLKAEGLNGIQIAERMGISRSYSYELLSDPEGHDVRARKDSYRGSCPECGGPTDGSNGPNRAVAMCKTCRDWTPELAIAAVDAFFEEHSRSPREIDGVVWHSTAKRLFGGWNELLLAAGLPLNTDRRPGTQEEMERLLSEGRTAAEVAEMFGWDPSNIHLRLRARGLRIVDVGGYSFTDQYAKDREWLFELYRDGRTYGEMAEAIGTTPGGIKARIRTMRRNGWDLPYRDPDHWTLRAAA